MIKKLWLSILRIGAEPNSTDKQLRRIALINQYVIISILVYFINAISDLFFGYYSEGIVLACTGFLFLIFFYLNKLRYHRTSVILLFILVSLTIFYFGTLASVEAGDYLYYFPLVFAISFVFDTEKDKRILITLFILMLCLILLHTYTYKFSAESKMVNEKVRYKMFVINLIVSVSLVGFFIFLIIKNSKMINSLYEQRLKEREVSEVIIKKALAEKEILLAELHHRVKNNLAIIVGFFNLKLNSIENEEARNVLLESKNHVNSMALIHNKLYKTGNFSEINFNSYLKDLLIEIEKSYPSLVQTVSVQSTIQDIRLNLNTAVPCALILNELLTNCYKHAFKDLEKGTILIDLIEDANGRLILSVKDNGVGLKVDFDKHDSLGMSIINGLSEQLGGTHQFLNEQGASFKLIFDKQ